MSRVRTMPRGAKVQPRGDGSAKATADTSSYSVEERLVASVWVHERRHTGDTLPGLRAHFAARFGRAAPTKASLLKWERKTFATGSVRDLPRCGRAPTRHATCAAVAESVRRFPGKSTRQRSAELGVPRSTMNDHIRKDLQGSHWQQQKKKRPPSESASPKNPVAEGAREATADGGGEAETLKDSS